MDFSKKFAKKYTWVYLERSEAEFEELLAETADLLVAVSQPAHLGRVRGQAILPKSRFTASLARELFFQKADRFFFGDNVRAGHIRSKKKKNYTYPPNVRS